MLNLNAFIGRLKSCFNASFDKIKLELRGINFLGKRGLMRLIIGETEKLFKRYSYFVSWKVTSACRNYTGRRKGRGN